MTITHIIITYYMYQAASFEMKDYAANNTFKELSTTIPTMLPNSNKYHVSCETTALTLFHSEPTSWRF